MRKWFISHSGPVNHRSPPDGVATYRTKVDALLAMRERAWEDRMIAKQAFDEAPFFVHTEDMQERAYRAMQHANDVLSKIDGLIEQERMRDPSLVTKERRSRRSKDSSKHGRK